MHPRTSGCPDRSPSRSPSTAAGAQPPRPARNAPAGSRRNRGGGRPVRPSPRSPWPPPSAPPGQPRWARPGSGACAVWLRDLHRAHRRRGVGARGEPVPDLVQIVLQIGLEFHDRHRVHARCALVRLDLLPRLPDSPLRNIERLARCFQLVHATPPPGNLELIERTQSRTTRPLRSAPVTGASPLLRTGRQRAPRRYSAPYGSAAWGYSLPDAPRLGTGQYQDAPSPVPRGSRRPGSRRLHAGHHLASKRMSARLIPESPDYPAYDVVLGFGTSATIRSRSPSRSPPDASHDAFPSSLPSSRGHLSPRPSQIRT